MRQLAVQTEYSDLYIIKDGRRYDLHELWALNDTGNYEFNLKSQDNAFVHGGYVIGDGKIKSRTISLEFDKQGATEQEYDTALNEALQIFQQRDYVLYNGRTDRCYHIDGCSKIKNKAVKGFKDRWGQITVTLILAEEPFRLAATPTSVTHTFDAAATGYELQVVNSGNVDTPLIITATPTETTLSNYKIEHTNTDKTAQVTDSLLMAPAVSVIDSKNGTVRRGNDNEINAFNGVFLYAEAGTNTYKITVNAACTIKIEFTARFFV